MRTLVIGSTGTIGQEIINALESHSGSIIHGSRRSSPAMNIEDPASIEEFFHHTSDLDVVICAAGNASFGPLTELTENQIKLGINSKLLGQVNVVKSAIPKLTANGLIILTGGMLAYSPWPATSNIAMVNAALEGFVKAVALELNSGKRILIVHPPLVYETAHAMGIDPTPWPKAQFVAQTYISCLDKSLTGKPVFVEGFGPHDSRH